MEIDSYYILCPYCKSQCGDHDMFERYNIWDEESIEVECEDCNKKFTARRCVTVDYRTEGDCELNGEEHEKGKYQCKKCDVYNGCSKKNDASVVGDENGK